MALTTRAGTSEAAATLTSMGGVDDVVGGDESGTAAVAVVATARTRFAAAISILSAIDGTKRRKFDVRKRQERTDLNLKIARDYVFRNPGSELRDGNVTRMLRVGVERGAVGERD